MNDDELEAQLRSADPARRSMGANSWIDDLAEATMTTETSTEQPRGRRTWAIAAAAAAVVAIVGGVAFAVTVGGDDDAPAKDREAQERTVLALAVPPPDSMQMCIEFSPEVLEPMEVAFSGEVDEVQGETVRITPDHWYRGGDEATDVVLTAGSPEVLLEGGIAFEEGQRYLVSAVDGQVATCGLSGPYSEEMAAAYAEAFGD